MLRFPYGGRPAPRRMDPMRPAPVPQKRISYEDLMKNASFSPELSFLLAMVLKDGMSQDRLQSLLKDIEPYVSAGDKAAIHSVIGAIQATGDFIRSGPDDWPPHPNAELAEFSKFSRQHSLLDVMQRYAERDTGNMMQNLQRSVEMQENFDKMLKRMQKLRNMNSSSPEDMFEALSMFMPPAEQANMRNMQNMMRMMSGMKNFRPEDMMKFMGGMNMGGNSGGKNGRAG
jgi:hypothetical protein